VQADEADSVRFAAGPVNGVAVINSGDELRANFVSEFVFFDAGAFDFESLERRIFMFEFDRRERELYAHGRAALAFSS
jgi:hypothetical protein